MQQNPFQWIEIYVQDMDRARKFYETVFDWKLERLDAPAGKDHEIELWAFPMNKQAPGTGGALVKMQGFSSGGNSTLAYFGCADCSVQEARVVEAGGRVERKKFSIGRYGYIALVYDSEGNMFGLHSME